MKEWKANLIRLIHYGVIIVMFLIPFTNRRSWLKFYLFAVPALFAQWYIYQNKCGLTILEGELRGIRDSEGLIYEIINPIYSFQSSQHFDWWLNAYMVLTWIFVYYKIKK